jgi:hypothetical protein
VKSVLLNPNISLFRFSAFPKGQSISMEKCSEEEIKKIKPLTARAKSSSITEGNSKKVFTQDEYQLAKLGYKQEFFRGLGLFENWSVSLY